MPSQHRTQEERDNRFFGSIAAGVYFVVGSLCFFITWYIYQKLETMSVNEFWSRLFFVKLGGLLFLVGLAFISLSAYTAKLAKNYE